MDPDNWHSLDRVRRLRELLKLTRSVPGEYTEMGVYLGGSAYLICQEAALTGAQVILFDSFAGLSTPSSEDGDY